MMARAKPRSTKVTTFDNDNVRQLMLECEAALKPIAERYGLVLERKGRTYHRDRMPVMLAMIVPASEQEAELPPHGRMFLQHAFRYGLKPEHLGREIKSGGHAYKLVGLNPRARTTPLIGERNGKLYRLPFAAARALLDTPATPAATGPRLYTAPAWVGPQAREAIERKAVTQVCFKHEGADREGAFGPVWLRLDNGKRINAKDSDMADEIETRVLHDDGSETIEPPAGYLPEWFHRSQAVSLARQLDVRFVEG